VNTREGPVFSQLAAPRRPAGTRAREKTLMFIDDKFLQVCERDCAGWIWIARLGPVIWPA